MITTLVAATALLASSFPGPARDDQPDPVSQLKTFLAEDRSDSPLIADQPFATSPLNREQADQAATILAEDRTKRLRNQRRKEWTDKSITLNGVTMKFEARVIGKTPPGGRPLFISMHGGGGAPAQVNDQQWRNQINLYSPPDSLYIAPRAPGDTWDLWHQSHIDPLFDRLIENAILFESVNPERIYLMGYSAGGDGVYQLAPRLADRFAAAAMMAGHPNEAQPLGLRNLPFTIHMGANDGAFNRNAVARQWGERLESLRSADPSGYIHLVKIHEGKGHWMDRQDAVAVDWMLQHTRVALPDRVVWLQDDVTHSRLYWLAAPPEERKAGVIVAARLAPDNTIQIEDSTTASSVIILLHDEAANLDQPVRVVWSGRTISASPQRTIADLARSLEERPNAPRLFPARITVTKPAAPPKNTP
jgi:poly(3-hydroxybutyrate) depolymerase